MRNYIVVGFGGVIGALLRYSIGHSISSMWAIPFPMGTLLINLVGAFILSWFSEKVVTTFSVPDWFRLGFGTGLIGSFTTFSTFSVETVTLLRQGQWGLSILYVFLSLIGGFIMAYLGYRMATFGSIERKNEVGKV